MEDGAPTPARAMGRRNPDARGWRLKLGVLAPSTNTIVQPDFDDLRAPGVTNHHSRIVVQNAAAVSNDTFMAGAQEISDNTIAAVEAVLTCQPDYLVMGMSAVTFFGGAAGADRWQRTIEAVAGIGITTGSAALIAAFQAYGGIDRIAFLSPYFPAANAEVTRFMRDHGIEVRRDICLRCPSWTAIAEVDHETTRDAIRRLDGDDVDAIVQVGTNLSALRVAAEAEAALGKPVIAINAATYWHALRHNGIIDKVPGFGRLLAEF